MTENSSEILLDRYRRDSDMASFEIHTRYQNRLIGLAKSQLLNVLNSKIDADDIAQETFAAFFAMADRNEIQWQERGDLWRLLAGIAINKVKQQFEHYSMQKRNLRSESQLQGSADRLASRSNGDDEVSQLAELVQHVLKSEKPLMETVVKLRLAGYSFEEIAKQVGRSTRTIRRLIERLKTKLISDHEIGILSPKSSSEPANDLKIEQADYNDFHLLQMIGQGGFAKVYLAKQISSGKLFAIKAIKKKWLENDAARESFRREAKLLMSLSDSSFVKTYGIGQLPNGGCFLVLQWIEGKPLSALIESASMEERTTWMAQIRQAVNRLHAANIAHGDIRLDNVMIDDSGQVKLVDFGLGRRVSKNGTDFRFDLNRVELLSKLVLAFD